MDRLFSAVTPKTSSELIVKQVLRCLEDGELHHGQKLPSEAELCRIFGVSRSPVRDALRILVGMGWLQIIPGKGTFIRMSE